MRRSLRRGIRHQLASHVHYGNQNRTRERNLAEVTIKSNTHVGASGG